MTISITEQKKLIDNYFKRFINIEPQLKEEVNIYRNECLDAIVKEFDGTELEFFKSIINSLCVFYHNNRNIFELVKVTKKDIFTRMIKDDLSIANTHIKEGYVCCVFCMPETVEGLYELIRNELISYLETPILQAHQYLHDTLTLPEAIETFPIIPSKE